MKSNEEQGKSTKARKSTKNLAKPWTSSESKQEQVKGKAKKSNESKEKQGKQGKSTKSMGKQRTVKKRKQE